MLMCFLLNFLIKIPPGEYKQILFRIELCAPDSMHIYTLHASKILIYVNYIIK